MPRNTRSFHIPKISPTGWATLGVIIAAIFSSPVLIALIQKAPVSVPTPTTTISLTRSLISTTFTNQNSTQYVKILIENESGIILSIIIPPRSTQEVSIPIGNYKYQVIQLTETPVTLTPSVTPGQQISTAAIKPTNAIPTTAIYLTQLVAQMPFLLNINSSGSLNISYSSQGTEFVIRDPENSYSTPQIRITNSPAANQLPKPILLSPSAGAVLSPGTNVIFSWQLLSGYSQYTVELWGGQYQNNHQKPCGTWQSSPSCYVPSETLGNYNYLWRVQARDPIGNVSAWSDEWNFTLR